MKRILYLLFLLSVFTGLPAQTITRILLVGDKGTTKDIKEAKSFIAVKKYPNGSVELLDYKMRGPLRKATTYADATLSVLEGPYYEYDINGIIKISGGYTNNKQDNEWVYFNDTGKVILKEMYKAGELIKSTNPDTVKKETQEKFQDGDKEAMFIGKTNSWKNYLIKTLNPDIALKSVKGGTVKVFFAIDITGRPTDIHIWKSVEYVLDEESLRAIYNMPDWSPAIKNGEQIKAYRLQPFGFVKD
ncbi:MAG: energy transducer TonB [Ferruginibacter sp.]